MGKYEKFFRGGMLGSSMAANISTLFLIIVLNEAKMLYHWNLRKRLLTNYIVFSIKARSY